MRRTSKGAHCSGLFDVLRLKRINELRAQLWGIIQDIPNANCYEVLNCAFMEQQTLGLHAAILLPSPSLLMYAPTCAAVQGEKLLDPENAEGRMILAFIHEHRMGTLFSQPC